MHTSLEYFFILLPMSLFFAASCSTVKVQAKTPKEEVIEPGAVIISANNKLNFNLLTESDIESEEDKLPQTACNKSIETEDSNSDTKAISMVSNNGSTLKINEEADVDSDKKNNEEYQQQQQPAADNDKPKGFAKKLAFDKNKLSSAFKKIKSGAVNKGNVVTGEDNSNTPKTHDNRLDTLKKREERSNSIDSVSSVDTSVELIPPSSAKPLEFDLPDTAKKKHKKEKKKSKLFILY